MEEGEAVEKGDGEVKGEVKGEDVADMERVVEGEGC